MSSLVVAGDTSGTITVAAPAVAGSNTLTLPANTGTVALTTDVAPSVTTIVNNVTVGTGTSVTYSGLTLTNYKFLIITLNGVTANQAKGALAITSTGDNAHSLIGAYGGKLTTNAVNGLLTLDLSTGWVTGIIEDPNGTSGGFKDSGSASTSGTVPAVNIGSLATGYSTATTSITFTLWGSTTSFSGGTIGIYGLK